MDIYEPIEEVKAYWSIGQDIVLHEQKGDSRAEYGKFILKDLSCKLQAKYKRGFSVDILGCNCIFGQKRPHPINFLIFFMSGCISINIILKYNIFNPDYFQFLL